MKGFKGGMPGNLQGLMAQAQKMQADLQKAQAESESLTGEGQAGGIVKAVANGKNQLVSLEISKDALNPDDQEVLQDTILAAVNSALTDVQEKVKQTVSKATGGM